MKAIFLSSVTLFFLCACSVHQSQSQASLILKNYIQNRCLDELQQRKEWQIASILMHEHKKQEWENKICTCASEEAPKHLSNADFGQLFTEHGLSKMTAEISIKTVNACVQKILHH